jgi:hypothetical protein
MRCGRDGETMNDEFLYQLRVQPSASFAAKLKVRLDLQTTIAEAKRRAVKWYVLCGLLLGTAAVALIAPSVRTAIVSSMHWRSDEVAAVSNTAPWSAPAPLPSSSGEITPRASFDQADLKTDARPSQSLAGEQAGVASQGIDSRAASTRLQNSASPAVPDVRRVVHIAIASDAKDAADKMIVAFEAAYGYEAQRKLDAQPACSRWPMPDGLVTLGRIREYEDTLCRKAGVTFITTPVAYDAYVAIVNRENTWAQSLTIDDLRTLADPPNFPNALATWNQVRPEWPSLPINVFGLDSTRMKANAEMFAPVRSAKALPLVIGKDDADIVKTIDATYGGLGFMRFATYIEQLEQARGALPVRALPIVSESNEVVPPSNETVQSGRYDTLSRPLLLHVNSRSLHRIEVVHFGTHTVEAMPQQLSELGYTGIDKLTMDAAARKLRGLASRPR